MLKTDKKSKLRILFYTPIKVVKDFYKTLINHYKNSLAFEITINFVAMVIGNLLVLLSIVYFIAYKNNDYNLFTYVLIICINTIVFMLTTGFYLCKKVLKQINEVTNEMKHISSNNLQYRLSPKKAKVELKELINHFNDMIDEIELSYEKKTQFVSDASHELRTPISVIIGYMNMLKRWASSDKEILEESIEAVSEEAEQMKHLVEKLLFLARSDKNKIEIERTPVDINSILSEMQKECSIMDLNRNIEFKHNIQGSVYILGSKEMLKQMLRVFLENSLKFTKENGNIILFSQTKASFVEFGIEDDGIGIAEKDLPHIFERFYKADKSRTNKAIGSGLGLSIAKLIIVAHGAEVHVASKENKGTKITIKMPLL